MDQTEARTLLPIYADGELEPAQSQQVEALLADSAELRAELDRWRALRETAKRVVAAEPLPDGLRERVQAALPKTAQPPQHAAAGRPRVYRLFVSVAGIAAVVALAVLWWPDMFSGKGQAAPVPTVQATLVAGDAFTRIHEYCAMGPKKHQEFKLTGDRVASARAALSEHLGFNVAVPDLTSSGYELLGCCTCFGDPKVASAHIYYRDVNSSDERMLSFFATKTPVKLKEAHHCGSKSDCGRTLEAVKIDDVTVVEWRSDDESFAVVAHMDQTELAKIAGDVQIAAALARAPQVASRD